MFELLRKLLRGNSLNDNGKRTLRQTAKADEIVKTIKNEDGAFKMANVAVERNKGELDRAAENVLMQDKTAEEDNFNGSKY